jgi:mannosylglycoprotein endo-beta-mannosidase
MRGWGANVGAELRQKKGLLLTEIKNLDSRSDSVGLSAEEWLRRYALEDSLIEIYRGEEVFWRQRSRHNWLLRGDANTAYFHAIANGRRRKCSIPCLWDRDNLLEDARDISDHVYSFYKELFMASSRSGISLAVDFWPAGAMVSANENVELTRPFSPEEVGKAIMEMKADSAPGPDGLPVIFFQKFWEKIQAVICQCSRSYSLGRWLCLV